MAYKKAIFMVVFLFHRASDSGIGAISFIGGRATGCGLKRNFLQQRLDKPTSQAKIPPISGNQTSPQPRQAERDRPGL